jgi:hypothetical protein
LVGWLVFGWSVGWIVGRSVIVVCLVGFVVGWLKLLISLLHSFSLSTADVTLCNTRYVTIRLRQESLFTARIWVPKVNHRRYHRDNKMKNFQWALPSRDTRRIIQKSVAPCILAGTAVYDRGDHVLDPHPHLFPPPGHTCIPTRGVPLK